MLKTSLLFLILVFSISTFARGGDELGNGGDVLYCAKDGKYSFQVLDLFEDAGYRAGFSVRQFPEETALLETTFFTALKSKDPGRACLYSKWNKEFRRDSVVIDQPVYELADEGIVMIPAHCRIVQTIVQYQYPEPAQERDRYFVYSEVFLKLDPLNMLALKIHEFIYREGIVMNRAQFKNSLGVRTFNSLLFSKRMLHAPQSDYDSLVSSVGLPLSEDYCNPEHAIYQK